MRSQFITKKRFLISQARFPRQQKTRILNFRKRYEKTIQCVLQNYLHGDLAVSRRPTVAWSETGLF